MNWSIQYVEPTCAGSSYVSSNAYALIMRLL